MFTGLIEDVAKVVKSAESGGGLALSVECNLNTDEINIGDSISIDGACRTVINKNGKILDFFTMNETLKCIAPFSEFVNMERAMRLSSRLDGHLVSGHVDTNAKIAVIKKDGYAKIFGFECDTTLIALKGSIAINGVSLTVCNAEKNYFEVSVLPETLNKTNLQYLRRFDLVNVEYDMIAKYIYKFNAPKKEITREFLIENGF